MAAPKAEATSQVEYDKLNERLTHLEEQVYRLLERDEFRLRRIQRF
jgi:hypothetical protein